MIVPEGTTHFSKRGSIFFYKYNEKAKRWSYKMEYDPKWKKSIINVDKPTNNERKMRSDLRPIEEFKDV